MTTAMTRRTTIDHAVGIMMSRTGLDQHEAFAQLRIMSQQQHRTVDLVAAQLVQGAVREAQVRSRRDQSRPI